MASGRSTNTMVEGLQNVLRDISQMKTMPDANLDFLVNLETSILAFLRKPMEDLMSQQGQAQGAAGGGSTAPGAPAGMSPMGPMGPPMGPNGVQGGPSFAGQGVPGMATGTGGTIPPDELRRLLQQGQ